MCVDVYDEGLKGYLCTLLQALLIALCLWMWSPRSNSSEVHPNLNDQSGYCGEGTQVSVTIGIQRSDVARLTTGCF